MMTDYPTLDLPEDTTIIPIDKDGKYVIRLGETMDDVQMGMIANQIAEWWDSNIPIIILPGNCALVRVDKLEDEDVQEKEED